MTTVFKFFTWTISLRGPSWDSLHGLRLFWLSHHDSRSSVWTCPHADLSKEKRSDFTLRSLLLWKKNRACLVALRSTLEAIKWPHDIQKVHEACAYHEVFILPVKVNFVHIIKAYGFCLCTCKFSSVPVILDNQVTSIFLQRLASLL